VRLDPVKADGMLGELDGLLSQLHMDARKPCFELAEAQLNGVKALVQSGKPRTKKIKNLSLGHSFTPRPRREPGLEPSGPMPGNISIVSKDGWLRNKFIGRGFAL
jgi:hypothetical protein